MKWPPVSMLSFQLFSKNESTREQAAILLGTRELTNHKVASALLGALRDESARVRKAAATSVGEAALKGIDMPTEMKMHLYILPAMHELKSDDPDPEVRKAATVSLERIRTGE